MLLLGNGGADKRHILVVMKDKGEKVLVMATTGKAATVIGGSTIRTEMESVTQRELYITRSEQVKSAPAAGK